VGIVSNEVQYCVFCNVGIVLTGVQCLVFCNVGIVLTGVQCCVFCNVGIVLTGGAVLGVLYCGYCADWGCNAVCSVIWVLC